MKHHRLMLLPGDGIGPEIMAEAERILHAIAPGRFDMMTGLIGGSAIDECGLPLDDRTLDCAKAADAVLLGAVGGPKWAGCVYEKRPEAGLLRIRKEMGLFANLRPALCFDALKDASSLKPELVAGLDILIVRELSSGVYFGEPRGIFEEDGERVGVNTQRYTTSEIERITRVAFDMARKRDGRVTSAEKSNVMEAGLLWREVVTDLHALEGQGITLDHMLADACAMQLVKAPKQFDVILTDNLFGDILSDEAAMLTGSLGMLPSASLGADGPGLYEPVHGSAPDIAGQGLANPLAMILSAAMALRYSLGEGDLADSIEKAVAKALDAGARTGDIAGNSDHKRLSTREMGDAVLKALDDL